MVDFVPPPSFVLPPALPLTRPELEAADTLFPYDQTRSLEQVTQLRAQGFTPEKTAAILNLVKARTRAYPKFGERARSMLVTEHGAEQATRPAVAAEHAAVFARAGVRLIADLGCGIGADSLGFARASLATVSVEIDPMTASFAAANLAEFPNSRVVVGDVRNFAPGNFRDVTGRTVQGIWLDPARRELTGTIKSRTERIFDPEAYSPPLSFVVDLARTGMPLGVKLGPGIPHEAIPRPEDFHSDANPNPRVTAQWVEHEGSLVELVLWFNALAQEDTARTVTVLHEDTTPQGSGERTVHATVLSSPYPAPDVPPVDAEQTRLPSPGEYLYEPSAAVVRAHLVQDLAQELGAQLIDPHLAYLTGTQAVQTPLARCYEVLEEIPVHEKQLKKWVRERGFTALTIKKRGVDLVPEKLRATLLSGSGSGKKSGKKAPKNQDYHPATLVFTRVGSGPQARRIGWHVRPVDFSDAPTPNT